jgi:rSAM/selenodomain-associated transferase 2
MERTYRVTRGRRVSRSFASADALISVIVPTLNEAVALPLCLDALRAQDGPFDITIVDGGSEDRTCEIAETSGARVIRSRRGRSFQMNHGAEETEGEVLLFLHADSQLPAGGLARIRQAVARRAVAGAFYLAFDRRGVEWRMAEALSNAYTLATRDLFGDRAIFITRRAFDELGRFRSLALMEDLDLSIRLKRAGCRTRIVPLTVTTSARRFDSVGIVRGAWWAAKLCWAFHRWEVCDDNATRFYLDVRR